MKIRVAGIQMEVKNNVQQNVETICKTIQQADLAGADILLTPEGSLSGCTHDFDPDAVTAGLCKVTLTAREKGVGLALGTCFKEADGRIYDQIRFYTADGIYLGYHSKILRCATLTDPPEGEINHFATSELMVFYYGGIQIGGLICNDMWANPDCTPMPDPHLSQQLSKRGAHIVFHAVNGGRNGSEWSEVVWTYHEANLRTRARASRLWLVTVDNCFPKTIPCSAPSGVIDPQGNWVCRTEARGEQFFVYTIELPDLN